MGLLQKRNLHIFEKNVTTEIRKLCEENLSQVRNTATNMYKIDDKIALLFGKSYSQRVSLSYAFDILFPT